MTEKIADSFELSPQQEQLWLAEPDGPKGAVQVVLALEGPLDADALASALRRVAERHEILRTIFVRQPGILVPVQAVAQQLPPEFATAQVTSDAELEQLATEQLGRPFDHAAGPPVRVVLAQRSEHDHALVLTISALCVDPGSATLLAREIVEHYSGLTPPIDDPLQYADFSAWQRELQSADSGEAASARDFWRDAAPVAPALPFAKAPAGSLPASVGVDLAPDAVTRINEQAARYGATATAVAHAAWDVLLGRSGGEGEVSVALVTAARRHADLEGAIGSFSRPVPLRARVAGELTFVEVLQQITRAAQQASVWQDYVPAAGSQILPIAFVEADGHRHSAGELEATIIRLALGGSRLGLWLTCIAGGDELRLSVDYDAGFLAGDTAERLARRLGRLLASIAHDFGARVDELELLDTTERQLLLRSFNDSGPSGAQVSVHELISAHAASAPDRPAVADEHGSVSYAELERRANQLANRLARAGVGPDVAVGLCTDRSVDMVVGLLGILKAGGAYVPLHYEHPPARLGHQLSSAGAVAVVTQEPLLGHLPAFEGSVICLDRDRGALDREPDVAPDAAVTRDNLVYVIYTSGSTGAPKGVAVTHGNLANYASAIARQLGAESEPLSFGVVTSISTDLGNTSLFGALCSGGTVVLISPLAAADAGALVRQLELSPIDVLKITPSHMGALLAGGDARVLPRRWLVLGGERAPWDLVARVRELSGCAIMNHYGPTEATVGCCTFVVGEGPGEYEPATVPIGEPIAGDSCYVLDERREPVPLGAPGRLHIGGEGVARGYTGAPELTEERFLADPFSGVDGARMYDTGDLARWLPDGTLEFLGRVDEQVKIRGYRVEPAEVESALRSHDGVREAIVVAHSGAAGDTRLAAYCAVEPGVDQSQLKSHLADWVPDFMVPSAIVTLDALPRTPSGKIDRLALPDPDEMEQSQAQYLAPRTPVEEAVAEIWAHVLGVPSVGVQDDFFALGGHSLLATQVVAQVRSDFAVELPLHSLFTYPTVASLSGEIVRMMGESEGDETARLMAELEALSDEEAERLLAGEQPEA